MAGEGKRGSNRTVVVGRVIGVFGVRGFLKVFSYTEPRENILGYRPWLVGRDGDWLEMDLEDGALQGKRLIARLAGVEDPESAAGLVGADIAVSRSVLPETGDEEYYWADLIGLAVVTVDGTPLGAVHRLLETGANDVLVVRGERERLIPYLRPAVVREIDLDAGTIRVDWNPDF